MKKVLLCETFSYHALSWGLITPGICCKGETKNHQGLGVWGISHFPGERSQNVYEVFIG